MFWSPSELFFVSDITSLSFAQNLFQFYAEERQDVSRTQILMLLIIFLIQLNVSTLQDFWPNDYFLNVFPPSSREKFNLTFTVSLLHSNGSKPESHQKYFQLQQTLLYIVINLIIFED